MLKRIKRPQLIIAFPSTAAAMAAETYCAEHGLPGRLIPLPGEISAGCGLAWKCEPEQKDEMLAAFDRDGISYEKTAVIEMFVREKPLT